MPVSLGWWGDLFGGWEKQTSGQDGGIGGYTLPPHTTKRTTTHLKTKNNQNCQKIELYGSLTIKKLKKKHSFRLVGGVEMGSLGREDVWQGSDWRTKWARWQLEDWVVPHLCANSWEEPLGS